MNQPVKRNLLASRWLGLPADWFRLFERVGRRLLVAACDGRRNRPNHFRILKEDRREISGYRLMYIHEFKNKSPLSSFVIETQKSQKNRFLYCQTVPKIVLNTAEALLIMNRMFGF
jgi:hypothetical protein